MILGSICIKKKKKKPLSTGFLVVLSNVLLLYLARLLSYKMNEKWQKADTEEEHWEF